MRWYFAIDEAGGRSQAGMFAKLAVRSAAAVGGLEPCLLYFGERTPFTVWMEREGVKIIDAAPSFLQTIHDAVAAGTYRPHSIGHWLRVAVPAVETEREYALYTDCDVVFLRPEDWNKYRPRVFAAAPEFVAANWNYFNAGVMVLNIPVMRATYAEFESHITAHMTHGGYFSYDDEIALNESYRGMWERLDPALNWKPYWGFDRRAGLLHFHGPKLEALESITSGRWPLSNQTAIVFKNMLDSAVDGYIVWCNVLADRFQNIDFSFSIRCANLASALTVYRKTVPPEVDTSFRNFNLFPD